MLHSIASAPAFSISAANFVQPPSVAPLRLAMIGYCYRIFGLADVLQVAFRASVELAGLGKVGDGFGKTFSAGLRWYSRSISSWRNCSSNKE